MSATVLCMSMSLDGFVAGPNQRVDNGLGDGGERPRWPLVTYVADVETAMARAKEAAGDKDVLVHGATVTHLRYRVRR